MKAPPVTADDIAHALGVTLRPYQRATLDAILERGAMPAMPVGVGKARACEWINGKRPTVFGFDAGTGDRTVIAAATHTADGASVSFVIVDEVWPVGIVPQRDAWEMPARPAFDWRASQRSQHKRRP